MKQYGENKATEFSKKQISVVYGKAKRGELKVERFVMSELYNMADYYGHDFNGSIEKDERYVLNILDAVFDGNTEEAQERINDFTEHLFNEMSAKYQAKADRSFVA